MSAIDRKRLLEVFNLEKANENRFDTWGSHLNFSPPLSCISFHFDGQRDVNIPVPVSDKVCKDSLNSSNFLNIFLSPISFAL